MAKIPVIICIDVEPDERETTAAKDWKGFEKTFRFFDALRCRLEEATEAPVRFSWFLRMDPQIGQTYGLSWWVAKHYGDVIAQLETAGDEIGLHAHAWHWNHHASRWVTDFADQNWIAHCLRISFQSYQSAFGRPCLSFRFGDHWMSNETIDLLEALGAKFDLTVEPGVGKPAFAPGELHTGSLPDYTDAPKWPYRPSRQSFTKEDPTKGAGLWMIPLSTTTKRDRFAGMKRVALALGIDLDNEVCQLDLGLKPRWFRGSVNRLIDARSYLAPVVRSDVGVSRLLMSRMEENMEFILLHPLIKSFKFVRPAEAIELLE